MSRGQCPEIEKYIVSCSSLLIVKHEGSGLLRIIYLIIRYFKFSLKLNILYILETYSISFAVDDWKWVRVTVHRLWSCSPKEEALEFKNNYPEALVILWKVLYINRNTKNVCFIRVLELGNFWKWVQSLFPLSG